MDIYIQIQISQQINVQWSLSEFKIDQPNRIQFLN